MSTKKQKNSPNGSGKPERVRWAGGYSDSYFQASLLAELGLAYKAIEGHLGLTAGQVSYRLLWARREHGISVRNYRNGNTPYVQRLVEVGKRTIKGDVRRRFDTLLQQTPEPTPESEAVPVTQGRKSKSKAG